MVVGKQTEAPTLAALGALVLLFFLTLWLRLASSAWDGWAGLHPDERHMVFVMQDMLTAIDQARSSGTGWFDLWWGQQSRALDPRALGRLYVYGDLPLLSVLMVARWSSLTDVGSLFWLGRSMTAVVSSSALLAVFILAWGVGRRSGAALGAALLLAAAPLWQQLANFYTVDAWLASLSVWALLPLARFAGPSGQLGDALIAGFLLGLALACKVTALALCVPALCAVFLYGRRSGVRASLRALGLGVIAACVVYRLTNPSAFVGLEISSDFVSDFQNLRMLSENPQVPSNWQWMLGYSCFSILRDFILFAIGPSLAVFVFLWVWLKNARMEKFQLLFFAMVAWLIVALSFGYPELRYFSPLVPIFAVMASFSLVAVRPLWGWGGLLVAVWWGSGVALLHEGQHPRLMATDWMRDLAPGSVVGFETEWDEALPLARFPPGKNPILPPGSFNMLSLRLTDPESDDTPERIAKALKKIDYLVISSGRQVETMPRMEKQFPTVARYYRALEKGDACFQKILNIDRGYPLPMLRINDEFSQESWRVYDHPKVSIWKKQSCFDYEELLWILRGDRY